MVQIVQKPTSQTVVVDRQRTVTAVDDSARAVEVESRELVHTVADRPRQITTSTPGVQGPQGTTNIPDTDALPEGDTNFYYTTQRAADAFDSAMSAAVAPGDGVNMQYDDTVHELTAINTDKGSVAMALHESLVDPHPQYLADSETLDGGNF